jgi:D-alanyl-lipoteichoic acid acyltransferase DltB (MBOAT superfamily)
MLIGIIIFIVLLVLLFAWQESRKRKISFFFAALICLTLSPIIGYFIVTNRPLRNPIGCQWCGNTENESAVCGICGKNANGEQVLPIG